MNRAPFVLLGVWLMTLATGLPLALAVRTEIATQLGSSLEGDEAARAVNYDWMQEFSAQATGLGATVKPTVIGFAAVLDNLSAFLEMTPRPLLVGAAGAGYVILWTFVAGGIIDRLARDRAIRAHGFFAASGSFFFRFLRLGVLAAAVYAILFMSVRRWLLDDMYGDLTRNVTVERTAFLTRVSLYLIFLAMLGAVNLVFDYAKVRAVVEDRRSMIGALLAALRFLKRNGRQALVLYFANVMLLAAVWAVYAAVAPGAGSAGLMMWVTFAIGQAYVLARLWVKLLFWSSGTALFQARLAHASYVARPPAKWPESPVAEAISGT